MPEELKDNPVVEEEKVKEEKKEEDDKFAFLFNTPDTTSEFDEKDIEENKIISLFSYLGILLLIPLFASKGSKFARYHINQGLILLIAALAIEIPLNLLGLIPYVGIIFSIIGYFADLVIVVFIVLGIANAVTGKAKELPFIGKFKLLKEKEGE